MTDVAIRRARGDARDLVSLVLVEAVGSSITPFVPVPFVDDYLFARLLRRIARKVVERAGQRVDEPFAKAIVEGYVRAGARGLGEKALAAAARFVVRKVAVVLDVKKSHDVFGEAIAFALALDVAVELEAVSFATASTVGGAIHRATESVGSAALEVITRAGRDAFRVGEAGESESSRASRVAEAIGKQVDLARGHLDHLMRYELARPSAPS
ncbi:MAG: hypothetical protein KF764_32265 [Labilithrix sp.]|nr:hypothetical protein [Labilithrix sp.]MBX3224402.1 hypothetical protein [Labilithrix sp.]